MKTEGGVFNICRWNSPCNMQCRTSRAIGSGTPIGEGLEKLLLCTFFQTFARFYKRLTWQIK